MFTSSIALARLECLNILSKLLRFVLSKLTIPFLTIVSSSPLDNVVSLGLYLNTVVKRILTISALTMTGLTVNMFNPFSLPITSAFSTSDK